MKKNMKVFKSILFVAACTLCLLCVSTISMLNESFASEDAPKACSDGMCAVYTYDSETFELVDEIVGYCFLYGDCYCYGFDGEGNIRIIKTEACDAK